MPARKSVQKEKVVVCAAPASKVEEAPDDSIVQKTSTYLDEVEALKSTDFETFNVLAVDRRIALLARFLIEHALRDPDKRIALDKKADLALRAISTLEGIKTRGELWVKELKAPVPENAHAYKKERAAVELRLKALLKRRESRKEVKNV